VVAKTAKTAESNLRVRTRCQTKDQQFVGLCDW
jgi:hypothetical protein